MSQEEDIAEAICDSFDPPAVLWLLTMAEKENVGPNVAANYSTYPGKIKSYAKEQGISPPEGDEIKRGYKRLRRVSLKLSTGAENTVILGDKSDYIKLTTVGKTLVTKISTNPELRAELLSNLGAEINEDSGGWWPEQYDKESAPITLKAKNQKPEDFDSIEIEAEATFECGYCENTVSHPYSFVYPDEGWTSMVRTDCEECGTTWEHQPAHPWETPDPVT